jgi:hypothetical protein
MEFNNISLGTHHLMGQMVDAVKQAVLDDVYKKTWVLHGFSTPSSWFSLRLICFDF